MKENGSRSLFSLLLVLLPGLAVTSLTLARFKTGTPLRGWEAAPLLLSLLLLATSLLKGRPLRMPKAEGIPLWILPALGYLLAVGIPLLGGLFPAGNAGEIFNYLWLVATTGAALLLLWHRQKQDPLPLFYWLLLGLALLAQPWIIVFGGLLFLPAALALYIARRHGDQAALLMLPALYWLADGLFDPAYGIRIWQGSAQMALLLSLLPAILFLLLVPVGLFLATSRRQQLAAIIPVPLLLLAAELWRSIFFAGTARGSYDLSMWLVRGGSIVQYTLFLVWILLACRHIRGGKTLRPSATSASATPQSTGPAAGSIAQS